MRSFPPLVLILILFQIGPSERGIVESPFWSYQLGLDGGWMPTDPRSVIGACEALGRGPSPWSGTFQPYMIGGTGAGTAQDADQYPWPPTALANGAAVAALPSYTSTGSPVTLPAPTFTDSTGNIIANLGTQAAYPAPTPVSGCTYPDPWDSEDDLSPAV